jgi:hypothetical protein
MWFLVLSDVFSLLAPDLCDWSFTVPPAITNIIIIHLLAFFLTALALTQPFPASEMRSWKVYHSSSSSWNEAKRLNRDRSSDSANGIRLETWTRRHPINGCYTIPSSVTQSHPCRQECLSGWHKIVGKGTQRKGREAFRLQRRMFLTSSPYFVRWNWNETTGGAYEIEFHSIIMTQMLLKLNHGNWFFFCFSFFFHWKVEQSFV